MSCLSPFATLVISKASEIEEKVNLKLDLDLYILGLIQYLRWLKLKQYLRIFDVLVFDFPIPAKFKTDSSVPYEQLVSPRCKRNQLLAG